MIVICSFCGKEVDKINFQARTFKKHFCNSECYHNYQQKNRKSKEEIRKRTSIYQKKYRQNPEYKEKSSSYQKEYHSKNRERLLVVQKSWRDKNVQKLRDDAKRRYVLDINNSRAKNNERSKKWRKNNPDRAFVSRLKHNRSLKARVTSRLRQEKQRAEKYNCFIGDLEELRVKYTEIFSAEKTNCYYCNGECGNKVAGYGKNVTVDHKTPLSKGGRHSVDNIVAACRSCNSLKNDKTEEEYRKYQEYVDKVSKIDFHQL